MYVLNFCITRVSTEAGKTEKRTVFSIWAGKTGKYMHFTAAMTWKAGKTFFMCTVYFLVYILF